MSSEKPDNSLRSRRQFLKWSLGLGLGVSGTLSLLYWLRWRNMSISPSNTNVSLPKSTSMLVLKMKKK